MNRLSILSARTVHIAFVHYAALFFPSEYTIDLTWQTIVRGVCVCSAVDEKI